MDHWSILLAYSAYPVILAALAPRIRFSLHKEFRDGEIRLYLHKEFRAAELGDDATENDNFQRGKQRLQVFKNFKGKIEARYVVWFKAFHMVRARGDIKLSFRSVVTCARYNGLKN